MAQAATPSQQSGSTAAPRSQPQQAQQAAPSLQPGTTLRDWASI